MLDFFLWPKKWEIENFFEIGPYLPTAPGAFFESCPQKYTNIDRNRTISARYAMLALVFNAFLERKISMTLKVALGLL